MVDPHRSKLGGVVEIDEAYVGGLEEGSPDRKADKKDLIAIAVEIKEGRPGRIRMAVIDSATGDDLMSFILANVELGSGVNTDGWPGCSKVGSSGYEHVVTPVAKDKDALPHVHLVISLLKRWLLGTHKGAISREHLGFYLDEFVFRFNRRKSRSRGKLFQRLIEQGVRLPPSTEKTIVRHLRLARRPPSKNDVKND
jgi:transposase-like protein